MFLEYHSTAGHHHNASGRSAITWGGGGLEPLHRATDECHLQGRRLVRDLPAGGRTGVFNAATMNTPNNFVVAHSNAVQGANSLYVLGSSMVEPALNITWAFPGSIPGRGTHSLLLLCSSLPLSISRSPSEVSGVLHQVLSISLSGRRPPASALSRFERFGVLAGPCR